MSRIVFVLLSCIFLTQSVGSAAENQQASGPLPAPPASLQEELADLNRSVKELVALLRQYSGRQEADLLLRRIEISLRKIAPLDQELRDLRTRRVAAEEELSRLRTVLATRSVLEAQNTRNSDQPASEDQEQAVRSIQLEAEVKLLRSQISQANQRIVELENELTQERRNIQHWEALIDQRLGLR